MACSSTALARRETPLSEPRYLQSVTLLRQRAARRQWDAEDCRQPVATLRSLQELSAVQVDGIAEDAWRAIVEANVPKGAWEVAAPAELREELRAAVRSHLIRLTQDWAERVGPWFSRSLGSGGGSGVRGWAAWMPNGRCAVSPEMVPSLRQWRPDGPTSVEAFRQSAT